MFRSTQSNYQTASRILFLSLIWLAAACKDQAPLPTAEDSSDATISDQAKISAIGSDLNQKKDDKNAFLYIPTNVVPQDGATADAGLGLGLVATATSYKISLANCASGLTGVATDTDPNMKVYKQDRSCIAKLTEFVFATNTYKPKAGSDFTTWAVGNTAVFENTSGPDATDLISVTVMNQLSSPISVTDTISYRFAYVTVGSSQAAPNTIAKTTVGGAHAMTVVGQDPPSFSISNIAFGGISVSGGSGLFTFTMTCTVAKVGNVCNGVDMTLLKYKLIKDTYTGKLTIQDAQALFPTGATSVVAGDIHATGNGGFTSQQLTGPSQIHLNPNMILIIEANGLSYQYFNVDVQVVTNP